jgi:hypothetical protein
LIDDNSKKIVVKKLLTNCCTGLHGTIMAVGARLKFILKSNSILMKCAARNLLNEILIYFNPLLFNNLPESNPSLVFSKSIALKPDWHFKYPPDRS